MLCEVLTWVVCGRDDVIPSIESRSRGPAYTQGVGAVGQLCRVLCVPESEWMWGGGGREGIMGLN